MLYYDEAIIYKNYENLYYAITKNNGKLILKDLYFKEHYPLIKSFFIVTYEYENRCLKESTYKNNITLKINEMEVNNIVSLTFIGNTILLFQYIFDYCIHYKMPIKTLWHNLEYFFKKDSFDQLEAYQHIFSILLDLEMLDLNECCQNIIKDIFFYKSLIKDSLIKLNPSHRQYIKKIIDSSD